MNREEEKDGGRQLPVFVYGTLRPGEKNYPRYLQGRSLREVPATVAGELFYIAAGGYPYLLPGRERVQGELIDLDPVVYPEVMQRLDALEEYDPADEPGSVYLRRTADVRTADGTERKAWVYYWNRPEARGKKVESGDFRKSEGSQESEKRGQRTEGRIADQ